MKRAVLCALATLGLAIGSTALGQSTIVGSGHDLSWAGGGQICVPCHTPHDAYSSTAPLPVEMVLWNHQATTQTFTMYTTLTGNTGTPDGSSLLCLSCHDGVTAIDNYGGNNGGIVMTGSAVVGTDLSDDHPIGIEYPSGNPNYHAVPQNNLPLFNDGTLDRVECASCHDPHGAGFDYFLRDTTAGSQICLDCHDL